jgi:hypothetical protein
MEKPTFSLPNPGDGNFRAATPGDYFFLAGAAFLAPPLGFLTFFLPLLPINFHLPVKNWYIYASIQKFTLPFSPLDSRFHGNDGLLAFISYSFYLLFGYCILYLVSFSSFRV